jgi:hypothetical protein
MGNRAVLGFVGKGKASDINSESKVKKMNAIYVHWNGGRDTIEPLLDVAREQGKLRKGESVMDRVYAIGKKSDIWKEGTAFDKGKVGNLDYDNMDNGTYVIDDNFKIVARRWHGEPRILFKGKKQTISEFYDKYGDEALPMIGRAEHINTKFMETDKEEQTGYSPKEMKDEFRKGITPPKAKVKSKGKIHPTWMF